MKWERGRLGPPQRAQHAKQSKKSATIARARRSIAGEGKSSLVEVSREKNFETHMGVMTIHDATRNIISPPFREISWIVLARVIDQLFKRLVASSASALFG